MFTEYWLVAGAASENKRDKSPAFIELNLKPLKIINFEHDEKSPSSTTEVPLALG